MRNHDNAHLHEHPGHTPISAPRDAVTGRGITVKYSGHLAIAPSDFTIPAGKITAVIGPNGSGKSTLLHAITGLADISAGDISVLGTTPDQARQEISYVLQYTPIPPGTPLTVRETVGMGRYPSTGLFRRFSNSDRERINSAMAELDISNLAGRHLYELSGGQRQRVYVAQGIVQDHQVLLLDEPLTGLDLNSAKVIDRIIHEEPTRGCTVVLTTHDLDEARAADHVILMKGRVIGSGTPKEVLTPANLQLAYGLGVLHEFSVDGVNLENTNLEVTNVDPDHVGHS